jgi:DNA polymerase
MTDLQTPSPSLGLDEFRSPEGIKAALDWWREAGVDCDFASEPHDWLRQPASEQAAAKAEEAQAKPSLPKKPPPTTAMERALSSSSAGTVDDAAIIGGEAENWPQDLASFHKFWLEEPSLNEGSSKQRIAPYGKAEAELMVLVAQPDVQDGASDAEKARLLSGPQGTLLNALLQACGIAGEALYLASALPVHDPIPDWERLAARGLGPLTVHHVKLAAPKRLLIFGRNIAHLLDCEPNAKTGAQMLGETPLMIAPSLDNLARSPSRRARFWNNWLEWSA